MKPLDKEDTEHIYFRKVLQISYFTFCFHDRGETQHGDCHLWPHLFSQPLPPSPKTIWEDGSIGQ